MALPAPIHSPLYMMMQIVLLRVSTKFMTQLLYFQADLKILEPMEEEEYSTESSNEEDMQEDGEREGNAAESDVFKPVDVDPACLPKVGMLFDSEEDVF